MDGLKTTETALNVNTLINNIPEGNIKKDSIVILELMKKVTNESPKIWGNNSIIGFGNYSYFRKNNKTEFKWFNIGFAPRKNKITLYLTCDLTIREAFLKKMGKCKWGKGCLHINKLDDIDLKMLKHNGGTVFSLYCWS